MPGAALVVDVLVVVVFAAVGRRSHAETDALTGVLVTAWPFLAGLAIGWAGFAAVYRRAPLTWFEAVPVWLLTVAVGMVVRQLTDKGTAPAFIVVATLFLGLGLLGWRRLARRWTAGDERV